MRLPTVVWLTACTALCLAEEQSNLWSWSGNAEQANTKQTYAIESNSPSGSAIEETANYNETNVLTVDEVIDTILSSNRQGRALEGFDEVYADPTVQDAIQKGDDTQARNLIKDKLCTLGLMQCDNEENVEGKRQFLAPGEFIYAQPPNGPYRGPPVPQGPPGLRPPNKVIYGPPKPMPNNFGPPRKVGYVSQTRPIYSNLPGPGPIISSGPPPDFQGPIYHSKPPGPIYEGSAPYKFESFNSHHGHEEHHEFNGGLLQPSAPKPTIVVNAHGGAATNGAETAGTVNIHHHYHHVEKDGIKSPVVVPVPVPVGNALGSAEFASHNSLNSGLDYQSFKQSSLLSGGHASINGFEGGAGADGFSAGAGAGGFSAGAGAGGFSAGAGTGGFSAGASGSGYGSGGYGSGGYGSGGYGSGGYGSGVKPVFEGVQNYDSHSAANTGPALFGASSSQGLGGSIDSYGQSTGLYSNGGSSGGGSFHSGNPDYYKKALNSGSNFNSINSQFSNGYGGQYGANYNGAGNNYQSIESARQDNLDCVCVPFEQCPARDVFGRKGDLILPLDPRNLGSDIEAVSDDENTNSTATVARVTKETKDDEKDKDVKPEESEKNSDAPADKKKVSKRDVSEKKSDEVPKAEGEGRIFGIGSGATGVGVGLSKKKVEPQFGVSFGLPYPSGAYPLNTLNGGYPAQNPYFGSISPNGLNLGLVNVNPLVSFQFAKNEYGEKLFKPLVNLHVTPNEHLITKVGNLFKAKKYGHGYGYGGAQGPYNQHYHTHTHFPVPPPVYHPHQYESGHYGGGEFYSSGHASSQYGFNNGYNNGLGASPYGLTGAGNYGFSGPGEYQAGAFSPTGAGSVPDPYYQSPTGPSEFDYNGFYSRSLNGSQVDNSASFVPSNDYQNVYPNNDQKQVNDLNNGYASTYNNYNQNQNYVQNDQQQKQSVSFPSSRRKRSSGNGNDDTKPKTNDENIAKSVNIEKRQIYNQIPQQCGPRHVCCRRANRPAPIQAGQCGRRNTNGITGRIKTPVYVDGDSEFGEYPWQIAILKKDPKESVYICGGTLIDHQHVITAAHCIKQYTPYDLRIRLGEWDVNHDVEFFPYIERDIVSVNVHPEYYAGTLDNDLAVLRLNSPVDFANNPHISPACLPDKFADFAGQRCYTTGWGKDAFGDYGKYQNILKEVDVPIIGHQQCQQQLRNTRLGYTYNLSQGFLCAGGEEGKDACKGDGGGPLVCERNGVWQVVGVVSWGIGCGQVNVPGVYVKVAHYLDWIQQITHQRF